MFSTLILLAVAFADPGSYKTPGVQEKGFPKELPFRTLETGNRSGLVEPGVFALRSQAELRAYLRKRENGDRPEPKVDWAKNMVIAVHSSQKPTSGYSLRALKVVRESANRARVEVSLDRPPADAILLQVITYPFVVVETAKFPGKVEVKLMTPPDGPIPPAVP
jgi:hypothetical protein